MIADVSQVPLSELIAGNPVFTDSLRELLKLRSGDEEELDVAGFSNMILHGNDGEASR